MAPCRTSPNASRPITRRTVVMVSAATLAAIGLTLRAVPAQCAQEQPLAFHWRVPQAHVDLVRRSLQYEGQELPVNDEKGVPLVVVFVGATLAVYLANSIVALMRDIVYGGVIIDLRTTPLTVQTDKSLAGGAVIVINPDGTHKYYDREEVDGELLEAAFRTLR